MKRFSVIFWGSERDLFIRFQRRGRILGTSGFQNPQYPKSDLEGEELRGIFQI